MTRGKSLFRLVAVGAFLTLTCGDLLACTACFGQSDSPMAKGMNMGIFTLLLVITSVLGGVASFFVYLIRRGSQIAEAQQPLATDLSQNRSNA